MPPIDGGWLDQHQRFPPPGPHPAQNQPEQAVRGAEAAIGTRENAQLVAKREGLEEEISTREQGGWAVAEVRGGGKAELSLLYNYGEG